MKTTTAIKIFTVSFLYLVFSASISLATTTAPSSPFYLGDNWGVNSNPHNLSNLSGNTIKATSTGDPNETRICVFCHTPHSSEVDTPLWNRQDPLAMGTFPVYGRPGDISIDTIPQANYATGEYPNGASKLCLSCHDGATAINAMINQSDPIGMTQATITDPAKFFDDGTSGTDLGRTHPFSFTYNSTVAGLLGGGFNYNAQVTGMLDGDLQMQCTTCHDPHFDSITAGSGSGYTLPFWRKYTGPANDTEDFDATCNACHSAGPPSGTGHNN